MSAPQILRHLHLARTTPFSRANALQDSLVRHQLNYKALTSTSFSDSKTLPSPPIPTIVTFSPTPVYTTGRREIGTLSPATVSQLQEPLPEVLGYRKLDGGFANGCRPEVKETLRGGQITFHGPGQLVIYPILDLKAVKSAKWPKGLSAKCFVNMLEEATINTLKPFGIRGRRTENPGVWVNEQEKIAALGLHLRRNITSFGVGLNVRTDLRYFDKIVACGLEGKKTTSVTQVLEEAYGKSIEEHLRELRMSYGGRRDMSTTENIIEKLKMVNLSRSWAREFQSLIWGNDVELQHVTENGESLEQHIVKPMESER